MMPGAQAVQKGLAAVQVRVRTVMDGGHGGPHAGQAVQAIHAVQQVVQAGRGLGVVWAGTWHEPLLIWS